MNSELQQLVAELAARHDLSDAGLLRLLECSDDDLNEALALRARMLAQKTYDHEIYMRGLIEFTSFCRNDCRYCGLRCSNGETARYRLSPAEILSCAESGHALGFRTFVLQGGEDPGFPDAQLIEVIRAIKKSWPDSAVTLSVGERPRKIYEAFYEAGCDRYLLRHETADAAHYRILHPQPLSLAERKRCLFDLRDIGFQTGCGIMVGSPGQTEHTLLKDLRFMQQLQPHMIGIGPFIAAHGTPFAAAPDGTLEQTLRLLSMLRLLFPKVLLPATTALGTIDPTGREKGILAGANVVMPNLSPQSVRGKYSIYDNKIFTGPEAAEGSNSLSTRLQQIGYRLVYARGDHPDCR
ncbi:MAG: [FeFe] hydrogenase H-cluster radical SAM maturase HydE [Anaerovoracaceae bacterium]|jgi:biotin synthase